MKSFVFYDGPSMLDGSPIVGIAVLRSSNRKTGDMVQTYILRADVHPVDAIRTGEDSSICGDCMHRARTVETIDKRGRKRSKRVRTCYVSVGQSVASVFGAWIRGAYPLIDPAEGAQALAGRAVRLGTYGDPAAIPAHIWRALLLQASGHTGYTHQWRKPVAADLSGLVMASADSALDRDVARSIGWRVFRVRTDSEALAAREIACPASPEGGNRRTCLECQACDGAGENAGRASIAIIVHGPAARAFERVRIAA
jgi:hypothetical protein